MKKDKKYRHELKYLCSNGELEILKIRLNTIMKLDSHTNKQGWYHIRSIYFDNYDNTNVSDNVDGVSPLEKLRIRIYNNSDEKITLECKRKECGKILKQGTILTKKQFDGIIKGERIEISDENSFLLNKFLVLRQIQRFEPKVIVGYDRRPYIYTAGNVRVTFDCNIFSSPDVQDLFSKNIRKRMILPHGQNLIEIKYDEYIPDFIFNSIQMTNMQQITFSKYYLCRKYNL